uniref:CATH n=1 Tax=Zhangixalus smaragdinus TaxID=2175162 RepID=A0A9E9EPD6_9NEOB|nr:CATH precursor [Zhangixalus smaragdinus]
MKIWQCFLWLSALTLHLAHSQSGRIKEALDAYNQREDGEFYFKLMSNVPGLGFFLQEKENPSRVIFLIKESECRKTEDVDLERCDYRKDGEVRMCALYRKGEKVECISLNKNLRTKRASKKGKCNFMCKVKQKLRAIGSKTVIGTVVHKI